MNRLFLAPLTAMLAIVGAASPCAAQDATSATKPHREVMVIPIRSEIGKPALYVLRRGLKAAIADKVDTVILDMDTPGGRLDVTLEMMEALDRFPGRKITFVNDEATSAGAIIASVTDQIYFAPKATIGSSEVIAGSGIDIGESMKRKINSYMGAKIRAYTHGTPLRAEVIRAMMDPEFELKAGNQVIKPIGELLNLTAIEANTSYGNPPQPLLGAGIANNLSELLNQLHGKDTYHIRQIEPTWAEVLAQYLNQATPLLLAIGLLALFIEFKTPGFGVFGITGIILLGVVFFGQHVAGLAGKEALIVLLAGLGLIVFELFILPGSLLPAMTGAILVLGSLVWMMLDIWPGEPLALGPELLLRPMLNVMAGVVGALALFFALIKWIPGGGPWSTMVLNSAVAGTANSLHSSQADTNPRDLIGCSGTACTALFPSGQVEIAGKRYEARLPVGYADRGTSIVVTGTSEFGLTVEVKS